MIDMKILNNHTIRRIANLNANTPRIAFKGMQNDRFEKTTDNPNTAFLRDRNLSHEQKMKLLKESDTIYSSSQISKIIKKQKTDWYNPEAFDTEEYTSHKAEKKSSDFSRTIFDLTKPINKENFEILMSVKDTAYNKELLQLKYGVIQDKFDRYIKLGLFKPVMLKSKNGKDLVPTKLIDVANPQNIEGIKKVRELTPKRSILNERILSAKNKEPINIDIFTLSKYGASTPKELVKYIKAGKLEGELIRNEEGKIKNAFVNVNNDATMNFLHKLRMQRFIGIETIAKKNGIDIARIEKEIIAGNIKTNNEIVFLGDPQELLIDTKDEKSIENLDKLLFEHKIGIELKKEFSENKTKIKKQDKSMKMKIVWHFCPNTRSIFNKSLQENPQLKELIQKEEMLIAIYNNTKETSEDKEKTKNELQNLKETEEKELQKFIKTIWKKAGSEEFKSAIKRTNEILAEYHKKGIRGVQDPEIKTLIFNEC